MLDALFKDEQNRARYLPAITHDYAKCALDANWRCGPIRGTQLDFLSRNGLFHYPAALASAGQAVSRTGLVDNEPTMVSERPQKTTFVMGDSGGFQVQEGGLPWFDAGDPRDTTLSVLGWMEKNADYVTALDFPTGGISRGRYSRHVKRIEGSGVDLRSASLASGLSVAYHACLYQMLLNTRRMLDTRRSQLGTYKRRNADLSANQSGFLVVLQGRNEHESRHWYEASRELIREADGVSFAGGTSRNFHLMLHRLLDIKRDGLLGGVRHIHVLGNGLLTTGSILTCIQRNLRAHTDAESVQITYDTADPFQKGAKYYEVITYLVMNSSVLRMDTRKISDAQPQYHPVCLNDWCWDVERDGTFRNKGVSGDGQTTAISQLGFNLTVGDLLNAAQGKHKGLLVPSHEAAWAMSLHNTEATVFAHSLAIDMYLNKNIENLATDVEVVTGLIDLAFNPRGSARLVASTDTNPNKTYKKLIKTFDIRDHLDNNAGIFSSMM